MPLIQCPICNKQVSSNAPTCPSCGEPIKSKKPFSSRERKLAVVIVLLVAGMFGMWTQLKKPVRKPVKAKVELPYMSTDMKESLKTLCKTKVSYTEFLPHTKGYYVNLSSSDEIIVRWLNSDGFQESTYFSFHRRNDKNRTSYCAEIDWREF